MQNDANLPAIKIKSSKLNMQKWSAIIDEWNKTQESQKSFCQRLGINLNTFVYARVKLTKVRNKSSSKFIPLTVTPNKMINEPSTQLILENADGIKLHLPINMSEDKLIYFLKLSGWAHA